MIILHLDVLLSFDLVLLGFAFEIVDQVCDNLRTGLPKLNVLQMDLGREDAPLAFHGLFLEFEAGNPALALFQFCKEISRGPLVWLGQSRLISLIMVHSTQQTRRDSTKPDIYWIMMIVTTTMERKTESAIKP